MNFLNTYPAIVVSNTDPTLKGRIKIRVSHLHQSLRDDELPWAYPMIGINGGSSNYGSAFIPEKDSKIWVVIENMDLQDPIFYISSFMWDDDSNKIFSTFEQKDGLKIGLSSQYPDVKFIKLKNGVIVGLSSNPNSPEIFMFHPQGSSLIFNKSGDVTVKSSDSSVSIVIKNKEIQINANSSSVIRSKGTWRHSGDFYAVGEVVARSKSDNISLAKHTHPSAVPGNPSTPTITPSNEIDTELVNPNIGIYTPQVALDPDTITQVYIEGEGFRDVGIADEDEYIKQNLPTTAYPSGENI
jgi:hypothetical protein